MKWTTTKPTAPGYYWLRKENEQSTEIVEVRNNNLKVESIFFIGNEVEEWLDTTEGEWYGPIVPPPTSTPSHLTPSQ